MIIRPAFVSPDGGQFADGDHFLLINFIDFNRVMHRNSCFQMGTLNVAQLLNFNQSMLQRTPHSLWLLHSLIRVQFLDFHLAQFARFTLAPEHACLPPFQRERIFSVSPRSAIFFLRNSSRRPIALANRHPLLASGCLSTGLPSFR